MEGGGAALEGPGGDPRGTEVMSLPSPGISGSVLTALQLRNGEIWGQTKALPERFEVTESQIEFKSHPVPRQGHQTSPAWPWILQGWGINILSVLRSLIYQNSCFSHWKLLLSRQENESPTGLDSQPTLPQLSSLNLPCKEKLRFTSL